jgi:hypothetical protein
VSKAVALFDQRRLQMLAVDLRWKIHNQGVVEDGVRAANHTVYELMSVVERGGQLMLEETSTRGSLTNIQVTSVNTKLDVHSVQREIAADIGNHNSSI